MASKTNDALERFLEQAASIKLGVVTGVVALVGAIFWFGFYGEMCDRRVALEKEIEEKRAQAIEKRKIVDNLDTYRAEVAALDAQLQKALEELPSAREIPSLLSRVSDQASKSGLDIKLFRPQPEKKLEFYAEVPVEVQVRGTFHEIGVFFDEIGRLERVVNVGNFRFNEPQVGEENATLVASLSATAYRFLEEHERPKPVEEDGKKGKKRRGRKSEA